MAGRKALLVGIEHYTYSTPLTTPGQDVAGLEEKLGSHGADAVLPDGVAESNFDFTDVLVSTAYAPIGRLQILQRLGELLDQPPDTALLFYFSGHAAPTPLGPELTTVEPSGEESGVPLDQITGAANRAPHRSLTIILDCCYSGAGGEQIPAEGGRLGNVQLARGASLLAASRDTELALEGHEYSKFTGALIDGLDGAAADVQGRVTAAGLHALADESLPRPQNQEPVLKTYSDGAPVLRYCSPKLTNAQLAYLTQVFGSPDETQLRNEPLWLLDPVGAAGEALEEEIAAVHAFAQCGLLSTTLVGNGANQHVEIRLTPVGRHYWRMVRDGNIP